MSARQPAASAGPPWTVGILVFDDVEVLDFCGPFEVFAAAGRPAGPDTADGPFRVSLIAERPGSVRCRGGLRALPDYTLADHPPLDILVVPGGWGTRREVDNAPLLDWIAAVDRTTILTLSVCTGAFLLAARDLLDGRPATTHWASVDRLRATHPGVDVRAGARFVDSGHIVTSAGVSAGVDAALYVVARLLGPDVAHETARRMEYESTAWRE